VRQQALAAAVAWVRLERAMAGYALALRRAFGLTPLQLSVLRILAERPHLPLAALRKALVVHPATIGQAIDGLRRRKFVAVRTDPGDGRARIVALTPEGADLIARAPIAGLVRLRETNADAARLDRLAQALEDALALFALEPWADGRE
jgi:DNA-binding MarR family transcriptional regulator